ncbi:hypothetical protein M0R45_019244 [Rubus argutus]|uniref:Uncharacterized protein n=1 Tax=Rubus argutus TaxID=59490 RepID=A0AAW1X7L8_RUBAR
MSAYRQNRDAAAGVRTGTEVQELLHYAVNRARAQQNCSRAAPPTSSSHIRHHHKQPASSSSPNTGVVFAPLNLQTQLLCRISSSAPRHFKSGLCSTPSNGTSPCAVPIAKLKAAVVADPRSSLLLSRRPRRRQAPRRPCLHSAAVSA